MSTKPPSRTADQFVLRLPDGMRPRIAEAAKANGRSMNAEIVARLEASFANEDSDQRTSKRWSDEDLHKILVRALEALGYEDNLKRIARKQIRKAEPK
jgi:Holliday junction resolvasome RuvABC DNA-binding subunit